MKKDLIYGDIPDNLIVQAKDEINSGIYERIVKVEKDDIVLDIGATNGDFIYSILDRKPLHCWVIEPIEYHFNNLLKNLYGYPVSFIRGAIDNTINYKLYEWQNHESYARGIIFSNFINDYCIDKIDFFKVDCEGGEYHIFTDENIDFIKNNINKISMEVHLRTTELKNKFRIFRDFLTKHFDNFHVYSLDGIDIKWDLYNEHFIEYYNEVMFYIDNRK